LSAPRELRPLSRALREAREESIPDLDWSAMEERLRALEPAPRAVAKRSVKAGIALAAAALSAAAALALTLGREPSPVTEAIVPERAADTSGGETAPDRETLDASNGSVTVTRPGRAALTLSKGGRGELRDRDGVITVYLDRGKVSASVEPSDRKESFAVEAAGVRAAVHGTKFSVELAREGVTVSVDEGVVLVGPSAAPGTGKLLSAGKTEKFTLQGEPLARRPKTHPSDRARAPLNAPVVESSAPPVEEPPVVAARSIADVESAVSGLLGAANRCFREGSTDGVRVTAQTAATFELSAEGRVEDLAFDPPLAPSVQSCIASSVSSLVVGEATGELVVTRRFELSR
jgi:ferric-dicitrate binding protein FerR (iron transport regulator)